MFDWPQNTLFISEGWNAFNERAYKDEMIYFEMVYFSKTLKPHVIDWMSDIRYL